jgi:hypothetical protein
MLTPHRKRNQARNPVPTEKARICDFSSARCTIEKSEHVWANGLLPRKVSDPPSLDTGRHEKAAVVRVVPTIIQAFLGIAPQAQTAVAG